MAIESFVIPLFGTGTDSGDVMKEMVVTGGYIHITYPAGYYITIETPTFPNLYSGLFDTNVSSIMFKISSAEVYTIKVAPKLEEMNTKGKYMHATVNVTDINAFYDVELPKIVSWSGGTDEEIADMVRMADEGQIDLSDYWAVGQERKVHLSRIDGNAYNDYPTSWLQDNNGKCKYSHNFDQNTGTYYAQPEQDITLILMNKGGRFTKEGNEVNFIVGQKDCLSRLRLRYYKPWNISDLRSYCNEGYFNAFPKTLKRIFKKTRTYFIYRFLMDDSSYNDIQNLEYITRDLNENYKKVVLPYVYDTFFIAGIQDILNAPASNYSNGLQYTVEVYNQVNPVPFEYYKTSANRIKHIGNSPEPISYLTRDVYGTGSQREISEEGGLIQNYTNWYEARGSNSTTLLLGLAPCGCI